MRIGIAAVLGAIAVAVLAAGCGGSSSSSAAPAAPTTTGTTTTGTSTTATPGGGQGGGNGGAFQAFRSCLTSHGVTLPARPGGGQGGGTPPAGGGGGGTPPAGGIASRLGNLTAKQKAAVAACQSKQPAGFGGGNRNGGAANPALAKYTACLKSHGVTFGSTSPTSSAFKKATTACKSLLPTSTGGSVNGGSATATP
ncbi:MAG: hypothetical protein QOF75_2243 [Gaiellaceae bacterium]|jgi:hypothetical protein|nr:hypothetical protein [Gaiellaceae bacterium]MDX6472780.1 hypothetical protein [Gaiellaceae bacterium]